MNLRNTLIALAVLALLVVVLFIVFREPPAEEMKASFPEVVKDHVTKVWLRNPVPLTPEEKDAGKKTEYEEITLERLGEGEDTTWRLTSPVEYPAYDAYVDTLLTRLEEIELSDVAVESRENWEALEVDDTQAVHVRIWAGKAELAQFFVGAYKTGNTMLRLKDDERVFKVQGSIRYVFGKRTRDWRDKTVLDQMSEHLVHVTYRTPDARLEFEKEGEEWSQVLEKDEEAIEHFDPKKVRSFVASLARLRTADFDDGAKPSEVGLDPPYGEVLFTLHIPPEEPEVKDGDDVKAEQDASTDPMEPTFAVESFQLLIGDAKDDKHTWMMLEGNPQVYLITKHLADRLQPTADKFATEPRPEGADAPTPMPPPGPPGMTGDSSIPPEIMKQVQAEIAKQKMMKRLMKKAGPPPAP